MNDLSTTRKEKTKGERILNLINLGIIKHEREYWEIESSSLFMKYE